MAKLFRFSGITLSNTLFTQTKFPSKPFWKFGLFIRVSLITVLNELPIQNYIVNALLFNSFHSNTKYFESQNELLFSNSTFDMCINKHTCAIFMIVKNTNNKCYYYITDDNVIRVRSNNVYCNGRITICNNKVIINAVITTPNLIEHITAENSMYKEKISYIYNIQGIYIKYNGLIFDNGIIKTLTSFLIINEMKSFENEQHNMITGKYNKTFTTLFEFTDNTTGLKKRGGFLHCATNNVQESIYTIDGIIVDKLSGEKSTKHLIGWNLCKNVDEHFRIVKLRIPESEKYEITIDEQFFMCYGKHCSNFAEFFDIQLPILNEEIFTTDEAHICVFNDNSIIYKIGCVVSFEYDDDVNNGCAKDLHLYKEKKYTLRYIPKFYDHIEYRYD